MAAPSHMHTAFSPRMFHSVICSLAQGGVEQLQLGTETTRTFKLEHEAQPCDAKFTYPVSANVSLALIEKQCWWYTEFWGPACCDVTEGTRTSLLTESLVFIPSRNVENTAKHCQN